SELPVFPKAALRRSIAAVCTMTYDVSAQGRPENICGVCVTTLTPTALEGFKTEIENAFLQSATQNIADRIFENAEEPYLNAKTVVEFAFYDGRRTLPPAPAQISCSALQS